MLMVLNPRAGGGTALARWHRVERDLISRNGGEPPTVVVVDDVSQLPAIIAAGASAGHRTFLAGGGDGTVNALASALLESQVPGGILGAVGLGSSNDFHKPVRTRRGGIPCRLDPSRTQVQDVGRLVLRTAEGRFVTRYWLVNASVGLTADANRLFNEPPAWLRLLKRISSDAAIAAAAFVTLVRDPGHVADLELDGERLPGCRFRNLGFVQNPNFAGCLRYEAAGGLAAGRFRVHMVEDVSRRRLLSILAGLARGRFMGRPGTRSVEVSWLRITSEHPFAVEFDGEVMEAVSVDVLLLPHRLEVCA